MVKAPNRSAFTLDGTRTFLIGRESVAVIDPGPDVEAHVRALGVLLGEAREVSVLLTHSHGDHAGAAPTLARRTGGRILAGGREAREAHGSGGVEAQARGVLRDGDVVSTDQGELAVVEVPGHTRDHLAFHWREADSLFVGDLILGRGNTTWLGEYRGCVADYLASLDKVRALAPGTLYPAHGPPVTDVAAVLDTYEHHRRQRLARLAEARAAHPNASASELLERVYPEELPPRARKAALSSVRVMLHHLTG